MLLVAVFSLALSHSLDILPQALDRLIAQLFSSSLQEKAMAPLSSTLAWKIPWTEEPGRLQTMALLRVGHD